jgi:hypothetical protein
VHIWCPRAHIAGAAAAGGWALGAGCPALARRILYYQGPPQPAFVVFVDWAEEDRVSAERRHWAQGVEGAPHSHDPRARDHWCDWTA